MITVIADPATRPLSQPADPSPTARYGAARRPFPAVRSRTPGHRA